MSNLNEHFQHGKIDLKNRLVLPPMASSKANADGSINQPILAFYDNLTKSGKIGLVILEHAYVQPVGQASANQISIARDEMIEGLGHLVDVIHANGSQVYAQLAHAGGRSKEEVTGMQPVSACDIPTPSRLKASETPRALSKEEIQELVQDFVKAALRAKEAGFDGVEIHSAHGYLLNQFYSPLTNQRTDEYGGLLENRIRIHLEIIDAIRKAVGNDFVIGLRLGAVEDLENGSSIQDAIEAAKVFEKAGLDFLDISGSFNGYMRIGHSEPGWFKEASKAVKEAVQIPVILAGGIKTRKQAEELLEENAADLIGVGRAILANPEWPSQELENN